MSMYRLYACLSFVYVLWINLGVTYHAEERDAVKVNHDNAVGGIIGLHDVPHVLLLVDKGSDHVLAGNTLLLKTREVQITDHLNIQDLIAPKEIDRKDIYMIEHTQSTRLN